MQKEIETRFLDINKGEFVKKLISLGATDRSEEKLKEIIFHAADLSWVGKNKFVRLRKMKDGLKLTYKTNPRQTVDSALEIELGVSDMDTCSEFLHHIGLETVRQLEKYRHTFKLGDVAIDIDTWPKIPTYAEIEGPTVASLKNACYELDLDWEKRFDGDAREVFRHYGHNLDNITLVTFSEFK